MIHLYALQSSPIVQAPLPSELDIKDIVTSLVLCDALEDRTCRGLSPAYGCRLLGRLYLRVLFVLLLLPVRHDKHHELVLLSL